MPEDERYSISLYQSYIYILALLGMIISLPLVSCSYQITTTPLASTPTRIETTILITDTPSINPPPSTASPMPTYPVTVGIIPDQNHLDRWSEIELALAEELLGFILDDGEAYCEWVLLGQTDTELYSYAKCKGSKLYEEELGYTPASGMPAVIHLGESGEIIEIKIPGPGTMWARDIRSMFPPEVAEMIFEDLIDYQMMSDHLNWRMENSDVPPLIVLSATPQP